MKYIVNVSGGLTSFEALRRCIEQKGKEHTHAYFADTLIEDWDLYRFLIDQERFFNIKIERIVDGRTPWQVMKDDRCITMQSMAPCSKILKREAIDSVVTARYAPGSYTRVFGYEWHEVDRMTRLAASIAPDLAWFPLAEKPYVDHCHISNYLESVGIAVPRLYALGFEHNNCGGGCVKAGQAHWAHLLYTLPDTYALWERQEEEIRKYLDKDISILKDRRGGVAKPMTLKAFRERLERGDTDYDKGDWGGCGCFAPVAQLRMDDWIAEAEVIA